MTYDIRQWPFTSIVTPMLLSRQGYEAAAERDGRQLSAGTRCQEPGRGRTAANGEVGHRSPRRLHRREEQLLGPGQRLFGRDNGSLGQDKSCSDWDKGSSGKDKSF